MSRVEREPHFTVVIPNKDRARYLVHTLRTCSAQSYERLEIIVADDASHENTREVVEDAAARDPRIRWVGHEQPVGMLRNFEHALSLARPGFVVALGGDDGLLPEGISGMRDALLDSGAPLLTWPAPLFTYDGVRGGPAQLAMSRARGSRMIESRAFLARQATELNYLGDDECPMFYVKGVVSTELVERVRARSKGGDFYSCPTPDGYSGIVLAGEVERFAFSGRPFSIYGQSPASQGLAYLSDSSEGKASSQSFFRAVASRPMHPELASQPYSPLIALMTADYLLTCRDLPGWPGVVPPIDFRRLLGKCLDELAHGLYGTERIRRELTILRNISRHHGIEDFLLRSARKMRRYRTRTPFVGTGVNPRLTLLAAADYSITNIEEAAVAAAALHRAWVDLQPSALAGILWRSIRYKLAARQKGDAFPPSSEWASEDPDV